MGRRWRRVRGGQGKATVGGRQDHRRPTVGEGTAVKELERIGDVGALEHRVEADLLPELRLRIVETVPVILHRHVRHLLLGGPVLLHVGARDEGEDAGEGETGRLLVGRVRAEGEVLGGVVGGHVQDALRAAHQDHVGDARTDLHHRVPECRVAGRARVLEAGGRDGGQAQQGGGQRPHVQLALALPPGDVAVVERLDGAGLDVRVDDGVAGGFREELRARAIVLAEPGHADSDHGDAAHPDLQGEQGWGVLAFDDTARAGGGQRANPVSGAGCRANVTAAHSRRSARREPRRDPDSAAGAGDRRPAFRGPGAGAGGPSATAVGAPLAPPGRPAQLQRGRARARAPRTRRPHGREPVRDAASAPRPRGAACGPVWRRAVPRPDGGPHRGACRRPKCCPNRYPHCHRRPADAGADLAALRPETPGPWRP